MALVSVSKRKMEPFQVLACDWFLCDNLRQLVSSESVCPLHPFIPTKQVWISPSNAHFEFLQLDVGIAEEYRDKLTSAATFSSCLLASPPSWYHYPPFLCALCHVLGTKKGVVRRLTGKCEPAENALEFCPVAFSRKDAEACILDGLIMMQVITASDSAFLNMMWSCEDV